MLSKTKIGSPKEVLKGGLRTLLKLLTTNGENSKRKINTRGQTETFYFTWN